MTYDGSTVAWWIAGAIAAYVIVDLIRTEWR